MEKFLIDKVKTGRGLAGSRIALIFAPPDAPPGSLTALTRFFNEQDHLRALPGYHGPNQNHVLRISGLKNDASFTNLLQHELPRWLQQNGYDKDMLKIDANLELEPVDEVDHFPHKSPALRFIKENATSLAGTMYIIGNMGLLYSAWRLPGKSAGMNSDWFKTYSSFAYNIAAGLMIAMSRNVDNPRDVYTIMETMYPKLKEASPEQKEQIMQHSKGVIGFLREHPWEAAAALNMTGAATHIASTYARSRKGTKNLRYEAISAMGTLTAMAMITFIPHKNEVETEGVFAQHRDHSMLDTLDALEESEPSKGHASSTFKQITEWLQKRTLSISAAVMAASNTGYGLAALKQGDPGLLTASGFFLAGNAIQSQARKQRGPGYDDVVTAAAAIIHSDPMLVHKSPAQIQKRIDDFAQLLTQSKEVSYDKHIIAKGIKARLERHKLSTAEASEQPLAGFVGAENDILRDSPFISARYVRSVTQDAVSSGAGVS